MSFAVVHMKKIKGFGLKGVQFHHQRERESETNPDIDKERTKYNYDIENRDNIDFNERVKQIISNNVKSDRAVRKDAVRLCDFVVTSDKDFFANMSEEKQRDFFSKSVVFFKEEYGRENIAYAKVHLDEHTPHMHLGLVPIDKEGKLRAKTLFGKQGLRDLQDKYPEFMQRHGFDLKRGEPKENKKHIETVKFKKEQIKDLSNKLDKNIDSVKTQLEGVGTLERDLRGIDNIESKDSLIGSKTTIKKADYKKLVRIAKNSALLKIENSELRQENEQLKKKLELNKNNSKSISNLAKENHQLKRENKAMERVINRHNLSKEVKLSTPNKDLNVSR